MENWYKDSLKPMKPIKPLTLEDILDINEGLREDALKDPHIEYSGVCKIAYQVSLISLRHHACDQGFLESIVYHCGVCSLPVSQSACWLF